MSSSDFEKVLIRDERLDCHDAIPFAVYRSGSNVTVATFNAISESASSMVFNVQVPSETTVIDRRIIWESTLDFDVTFTASGTANDNQVRACEYGIKQAFCAWPLHSLCNTMQATINNNSVTINAADVLPALSRMHDMRELQRYNGMSPIKPDNFLKYSDGLGSINNVLGGAQNIAMENDYMPRGAIDVAVSWVQTGGNLTAGTSVPTSNNAVCKYHVRATLREPLLMSPFIYAHPFYNGQGFYGLQNLNLVFNLNGGAAGLWRCMDNSAYVSGTAKPLYAVGSSPVISGFQPSKSRLIFNFLTPKPSDLLAARNVVPYWEMPRYLKSAAIAPILAENAYNPNAAGTAPADITFTQVQSQSLQLNQVPDKLIVFFRPQQQDRTAFMTDRTMIINNISINWNNQSGILASATQDQLWRFSVESGSIQSWQEFSGVYSEGGPQAQQAAPGGAGGNQFGQLVPTVGSYLMLDFAKHINITEDYYAPGSLGNFNLQFTVTVGTNNREASGAMDMVIITVNSGLFVTEKGQSATYTGILTKDDVLSAAAMKPVSDAEARRLVGGLNIGSLLNTAGKVAKGIQKYSGIADAAVGLLPEGKIKSGLQTGLSFAKKGADVASKLSGDGMRGRGRGSQVFNIQDRLV